MLSLQLAHLKLSVLSLTEPLLLLTSLLEGGRRGREEEKGRERKGGREGGREGGGKEGKL